MLEKAEDVCCGTSKANSAIVHAGYDAANGSLMAKLNVQGNQMMEDLSKELDFSFNRCGSLVVCIDEDSLPDLKALYERGVKNGVKDMQLILDREEIFKLEPNLSEKTVGVLRGRPLRPHRRYCVPLRHEHRHGGERRHQRCGVPL